MDEIFIVELSLKILVAQQKAILTQLLKMQVTNDQS